MDNEAKAFEQPIYLNNSSDYCDPSHAIFQVTSHSPILNVVHDNGNKALGDETELNELIILNEDNNGNNIQNDSRGIEMEIEDISSAQGFSKATQKKFPLADLTKSTITASKVIAQPVCFSTSNDDHVSQRAFQETVLKSLGELNHKMNRMCLLVNEIVNIKITGINNLDNSSAKLRLQSFFGIKIPLDTLEKFEKFTRALESNEIVKKYVEEIMHLCVDKDGVITKSIVHTLKEFMSKDLALKFNAIKEQPGKPALRTTSFFVCLENIIKSRRELNLRDTEEKEIRTALSDVMSNVKKWKNVLAADDVNNN